MVAPSENSHKGLKRLVNAFHYSVHGFTACFRTEEAFRQETFLALIFGPLGIWLGQGMVEKSLLVGVVFIVLIVELLNTAVERAIDRISFEKHDLSKDAKDMGSAAVLLSLLFAGFVWLGIGVPRMYELFQ